MERNKHWVLVSLTDRVSLESHSREELQTVRVIRGAQMPNPSRLVLWLWRPNEAKKINDIFLPRFSLRPNRFTVGQEERMDLRSRGKKAGDKNRLWWGFFLLLGRLMNAWSMPNLHEYIVAMDSLALLTLRCTDEAKLTIHLTLLMLKRRKNSSASC